MPRQISEMQSLPFHQIIGAPLLAIVQGQAQASQATAEFIERIGFRVKTATEVETTKEDDLGDLRMVTFSYQKPDAEGNINTFKVEIPLLSLVPIPAIQIRDADLEFNVKITDVLTSETKMVLSSPEAEAGDWLSKGRVEFRAAMGKMEIETAGRRTIDLQMKVKLKVEQADITSGLSFLFRLMDQSISSSVVAEEVT